MRWYWTKIGLGALAVFVVGFGVIRAVSGATSRVETMVHSSSDISLPLPFVPFVMDGAQAGKLRRLVLHRSDPKHLSGIDVSVRVADASVLAKLGEGCRLTVDNPREIGNHTTFSCVALDAAVEQFGEVAIYGPDADGDYQHHITLPLVLPPQIVADLRGAGADVAESFAGAEADQIRVLADSIRAVGAQLADAPASDRSDLRAELRRLEREMRDVERAAAEVARVRATVRAAEGVKVEVVAPAPKDPGGA